MFALFSDLLAAPAAAGPNPIMNQIALFGVIFLIFYFLVLRPQSKKAKDHRGMLESLQKGDAVITASGIYGVIAKKPEEGKGYLFVEIAEKATIKIQKSQVSELAKEPKAEKKKEIDKKDSK